MKPIRNKNLSFKIRKWTTWTASPRSKHQWDLMYLKYHYPDRNGQDCLFKPHLFETFEMAWRSTEKAQVNLMANLQLAEASANSQTQCLWNQLHFHMLHQGYHRYRELQVGILACSWIMINFIRSTWKSYSKICQSQLIRLNLTMKT